MKASRPRGWRRSQAPRISSERPCSERAALGGSTAGDCACAASQPGAPLRCTAAGLHQGVRFIIVEAGGAPPPCGQPRCHACILFQALSMERQLAELGSRCRVCTASQTTQSLEPDASTHPGKRHRSRPGIHHSRGPDGPGPPSAFADLQLTCVSARCGTGYISAVSKKLTPASAHWLSRRSASWGGVLSPNSMVPAGIDQESYLISSHAGKQAPAGRRTTCQSFPRGQRWRQPAAGSSPKQREGTCRSVLPSCRIPTPRAVTSRLRLRGGRRVETGTGPVSGAAHSVGCGF